MSPILLLTFCLEISLASLTVDPSLDVQWLQWKTKYERTYNKKEEEHRRAIWEENIRIIDRHNREHSEGKHNYTMEMNTFGDMTNAEFRTKMIGLQNQVIPKRKIFQKRQASNLPKSVDWRERGYVTPVKMQGSCNSCWAFSATGALEGQLFRKTGQLVELSAQNLVDCSQSQGNNGCSGGRMEYAFKYVRDNGGLNTAESYPYEAQEGPCRYRPEKSAVSVTYTAYIPQNEAAMMNAVANVGPISAAVNIDFDSFQFYRGGIYYEPSCTDAANHAVLVVGYGYEGKESDNNHYWLIKNSWGTDWGIDGYMKLAKDRNNHCGIATEACFPFV